MLKARAIHLTVVIGFLAIIASAGLIQSALELKSGEWPQALELFKQKPTVANLRRYERNLEEGSWLARQARPWYQYAQFVLLKEGGEKALVARDGWLFYKPGYKYLTERFRDSDPARELSPLPAIVHFRDELARRGIHLLVLPAPNKESIYPDKLDRRVPAGQQAICPESAALLRNLKAAGVDVIDLFEFFARVRRTNTSPASALYLAQDSHWSPAGLELAAEAVAQRLLERGWIEPGTFAYQTRPAALHRQGDILRMLQIPQLESRAPPEALLCAQVIESRAIREYADDPDSQVLVIGDSFLRIFQQDEPGAAGFIAHLARKLKQPLTSLVSDGGGSTLVRQELFRRPALLKGKKVVVWEFVERDIRYGAEGWQLAPLPPELTNPRLP